MRARLATILLASVISAGATAADLGPYRSLQPQPNFVRYGNPAFTWTGFYLGGQVGYGWGEDKTALILNGQRITFDGLGGLSGDTIKHDIDGAVGGGHAGFNYQAGNFVIGLEADVEASGVNGSRSATERTVVNGVPVSG